jgi:hypothetical protein
MLAGSDLLTRVQDTTGNVIYPTNKTWSMWPEAQMQ